ncbi:MAG: DNA polymerase III subunit delta' [Syntrophobacterales bacterium]|nr:MAG: DNA polymerase III subunit delta' [Syntrophobacterales bacterium]
MSFKDIIGHDSQIEHLRNAMRNGRVAHAYLFLGKEGIGKKLVALSLAKALNCPHGSEDPCDECRSCLKVEHLNHPDVILVEPQGQWIRIDQIRDLQRELSHRPYEGKRRVCIFSGSDRLRQEAANALLKILEEPPLHTVMILLAANLDLILPTIASRCQKIPFNPLPFDRIAEVVRSRLELQREEAHILASHADGSLGKALHADLDFVLRARREIIEKIIDLPSYGAEQILGLAEELSTGSEDLPKLLTMIHSWYRDLLTYKERGGGAHLINIDLSQEIQKVAPRTNTPSLIHRMEVIQGALWNLDRNANRQITLEAMFLDLARTRGLHDNTRS